MVEVVGTVYLGFTQPAGVQSAAGVPTAVLSQAPETCTVRYSIAIYMYIHDIPNGAPVPNVVIRCVSHTCTYYMCIRVSMCMCMIYSRDY